MLTEIRHQTEVCVVGGGLAGLCAAVACARHGAKTLLMHERPVLGGNASSEIRMWICGAHGNNNRETGIIEELLLENQYRNPDKNYALWDSVLYSLAREQPGLTLLLNCTCMDGTMAGDRLASIRGYQLTTQRFHRVEAEVFIDCSGDGILAPITGAPCRVGREARAEHGESIAPAQADRKTMGLSCLIQARKTREENVFIPPAWAKKKTRDMLAPYRLPDMDDPQENFWYLELGGDRDCIGDTEVLRDELLAEAMGLWDYIKNDPANREKNRCWHLDWIGFLPGKRESRRYQGAYTLTQGDVEAGGRFDDLIAYGGWTMDDHHPGGLATPEPPNVFHPAPSPFGIPYRCLYSLAVPNLMFAGRNISATHAALSATRVMATCATLGQAAGTAAALAVRWGEGPDGVYRHHLRELQQALMDDDCYLPFHPRPVGSLTARTAMTAAGRDASVLKNGWDRPVGGQDNGVFLAPGEPLTLALPAPELLHGLRLILDSDLNRATLPETRRGLMRPMPCNRPEDWPASCVPQTLARLVRVEARMDGGWQQLAALENHQRLVRIPLNVETDALRVFFDETWGAEQAHIFAADLW